MQAATAAFAATIAGNDMVVTERVRLRLPLRRTNIITNPSFEYGTTNWQVVGSIGTPSLTRSNLQAHGAGSYSGRVVWGADGALGELLAPSVNPVLRAGTVYTFSAWVYVPAGSPAVVLAAAGTTGSYSAPSTANDTWQRLSLTFTATQSDYTVAVQNNSTATAGQLVYVDELLLEEAATAGTYFDGDNASDRNLVGNSSFENMLMPDVWLATNCTAARDNTWSNDGDYSCALTPTLTPGGYLDAERGPGALRCSMMPGRTYTASVTVNVPKPLVGALPAPGTQRAGIVLSYHDGTGQHDTFAGVTDALLQTGGTARVTVTATLSAGADQAWLRLVNGLTGTVALDNVVRFDAVLLRQAATDSAYFPSRRLSDNTWLGVPGASQSTLVVDPYPDVTLAAESVQVTRQMTTDLPAGTRLVSGVPVATAQVVLSGLVDSRDESKTAAWLLNPYEPTSPLYHRDGLDADVVIERGLITATGEELLTTFTGGVDSVAVDSNSGTVTLACLDPRNKLRPTVTLPSFAYQSQYGGMAPSLTGGWVIDAVLRQNGIHTSPPPRALCGCYVSFHGAAWPEYSGTQTTSIGTNFNTGARDFQDPASVQQHASPSDYMGLMREGPFGRQVVKDPVMNYVALRSGAKPYVGTGGHMFFEGWMYIDSTADGSTTGCQVGVLGLTGYNPSIALQWNWELGDRTATALMGVARSAGSSGFTKAVAGASLTTDTWHHVAVYITFPTSTTATITSTIDGVATINNITGLPAAIASEQAVDAAVFVMKGWADSFQITNEVSPTPVSGYNADAYLDASLNALVATADTTGQDPWTVMQLLAQAEQGVAGFDEHAVFRFRNRDNLAAQTAVRSITAAATLKAGLSYTVGKSTLANHVTAPVNVLQVDTPANVYSSTQAIRVGASRTVTVLAETQSPVLAPQAPDAGYIGTGGGVAGQTYWRASKTATGTTRVNSGISVVVTTVSPTTLSIAIKNTNAFAVYMVSPTTETDVTAGTPWLFIGGVFAISPPSTPQASSVWQPSIDERGETALQLPANQWLQDLSSAQSLTDAVVADLYRPRPILQGLAVVLDPRLQLTDRVTIYDPDGSRMNDDVVLSGITSTVGSGSWEQTLDARAAGNPGDWIMGRAGHSELGTSTYT